LEAGFLGAHGLSSADLLPLQAQCSAKRKNKSVILLWLDGGPSHLETYDPKPAATSASPSSSKAATSASPTCMGKW
jgi:hypothetical protein